MCFETEEKMAAVCWIDAVHTWESSHLGKHINNNANKNTVILWTLFIVTWCHHKHLRSPLHVYVFNSSPGTSSLLKTFCDAFSDHLYNLQTLESMQLKSTKKSEESLICALFVTSAKCWGGCCQEGERRGKNTLHSVFRDAAGWDASPTHHPFTPIRKQRWQQWALECCRVQSEAVQESKKSERRVCVWVCKWLREAVSFDFFWVVEHQHHTVWSSKDVHSGRITAYCLWQR